MKKTLIYLQSEEDDYYLEKIQKLANEKLALFALGKLGASEERNQVNKLLKKPKGVLKRERLPSMGQEDHHEIENKNEKQDQNRLNMAFKKLETQNFLTMEEIEILNRHKHDENCGAKLGIEVGPLGPTFQMYDQKIELKIWDMPKTSNYVLITNWYIFVIDHKNILKEGAKIQVWSYRKDQQLCFAVVCVDHKVEEIHDDAENDVVADRDVTILVHLISLIF